MKKKIIISLFTLLLGVACFTSCKKKDEGQEEQEPTITYEEKTITEVLTDGTKDSYYKVSGVVFAKETGIFFVSDGENAIEVSTTTAVEVGDKVVVSGKYAIAASRPYLKEPKIEVEAKQQTTISATTGTVSDIVALTKDTEEAYGLYYTVSGWLTKGSTYYSLNEETEDYTDYESIRFSTDGDISALEAYEDKYVTLNVITYKFADDYWYVFSDHGTITDNTPSLESEVETKVVPHLKEALHYTEEKGYESICGALELPIKHANRAVNGLSYSWVAKEYTVDAEETKTYVLDETKYEEIEVTSETFADLKAKLFTKGGTEEEPVYTAVGEAEFVEGTVYYVHPISNGGVEIDNDTGSVKVTIPEADKKVELTCIVSRGEEEETKEVVIDIVSKALVSSEIVDILDTNPSYNYTAVKFQGVVIAKAQNQSGSSYGLIVADEDARTNSIQVEVNFSGFQAYNINDVVEVTGFYRNGSSDRRTVTSQDNKYLTTTEVTSVKTLEGDDVVKYDNAVLVVDSEEDFQELIANYDSKYVGRLVKFVNPTLVLTTRSGGNTIDISYGSTETAKINGTGAEVTPCFVAGRIDSLFGTSAWRTNITSTKEEYEAVIYAIPSYYSGLAIFTIPTADQVTYTQASEQIAYEIAKDIKDMIRIDGDIELPETIKYSYKDEEGATQEIDLALTWTSEDETAITNAGECTYGTEEKQVVLTATYTLNEVECTSTVTFTLASNTPTAIKDLTDSNDGGYVLIEGQVVAYATSGSFTSAGKSRTGWVLMDTTSGDVIYTYKANTLGGDITNGFTVGDHKVAIGDILKVYGLYRKDSENPGSGEEGVNNGRACIDCTEMTIVSYSENKEVDLDLGESSSIITVTNETELKTLVASGVPFGKIIKFVATEENPIHIQSGSTSKMTSSSNTVVLRFGYSNDAENSNKTTKYECAYEEGASVELNFGLSAYANELTYSNFAPEFSDGNNFWNQIGFKTGTSENITESGAGADKTVYGEFYAVVGYVNSTYYHMALVDPANTWNVYEYDVTKTLSASTITDGDELELPATYRGKEVAWSTTSTDYKIEEGKLVKDGTTDLTANVTVTLKAVVTNGEEHYEYTKDITVEKKAVKKYVLVTDASTLEVGDKFIFVYKYASGETTKYQAYDYGLTSGPKGVSITVTGNTVDDFAEKTVETFYIKAKSSDGKVVISYTFEDGKVVYGGSSTSGGFGFSSATSYSSRHYWSITSNTDNTVTCVGDKDGNGTAVYLGKSASDKAFSRLSAKQANLYIYKLTEITE